MVAGCDPGSGDGEVMVKLVESKWAIIPLLAGALALGGVAPIAAADEELDLSSIEAIELIAPEVFEGSAEASVSVSDETAVEVLDEASGLSVSVPADAEDGILLEGKEVSSSVSTCQTRAGLETPRKSRTGSSRSTTGTGHRQFRSSRMAVQCRSLPLSTVPIRRLGTSTSFQFLRVEQWWSLKAVRY